MEIIDIVEISKKLSDVYKLIIKERNWKDLFIDNGDFLLGFENEKNKVESDLNIIFSNEEMRKLASGCKNISGYEIMRLLHDKLIEMFNEIECENALAEQYTNHFLVMFKNGIMRIDIELYTQIYTNEKFEINEKLHEKTHNKLDAILVNLPSAITNAGNVFEYETIDTIDRKLKECTNPSISLNFFDYEDNEFSNALQEQIDSGLRSIYIEGKSREEVFYCILSQFVLHQEHFKQKIYVVNNINSWEKARGNIQKAILVPSFFADNIAPISENINIFAFGEDEHCMRNNKIILRRRLRDNLQRKLVSTGISNSQADEIISSTHGIFVTLKRKLFQGRNESYPNWYQHKNFILKYALLLGSWTESDIDGVFEVTGFEYTEFMEHLAIYMRGEDPFVIAIEGYGEKSYQLANPEEAWEFIGEDITKAIWDQFCATVISIVSYVDDAFALPEEERMLASIQNTEKYSNKIRCGIIRSIILRRNFKDKTLQTQINTVIEKILKSIRDINSWCYISNYIDLLGEASPDKVLSRFENEIQNNSGLQDVMRIKVGDKIFGSNYYTYFIWTAEHFLFDEMTAIRAIMWLFEINDLNIDYMLANSPKDTLSKIFCAWHHESVLSEAQIIEIACTAVEKYKYSWEIFCDELPSNRVNLVVGSLSKPKYCTNFIEEQAITEKEVNNIYRAYIQICVEHAGNDIKRWVKMLENCSFRYYGLEEKSFLLLNNAIANIDDFEKQTMKDKIRIELYKHRRFAGSDWSYSKAFLAKLESIFESIVFSNPVLDYTYLFVSNVDDFPLLNPKVYDSDGENDYKQEVKEVEEYINSQMIIFKLNGYNLMNLIDLVEPSANYMLGRIIANVYCDGQFNRDLFEELLKHVNNFNIIYSYALEIYCTSEKNTLNEIIDAALELSASDNIIAILAKIEIYDINENPIIEKLSEQIKQVYWANFSRYFTHDKKTLVAVIERTLKYKNANAFIECLETAASFLTGDECISYLKKFIDEPDMKNLNTLSHYHLEKIFTRIYESFDKKYDRYSEIAYIELFFRGVLTWTKLKCFLYLLKNDPNYYAQMLDIVYVHEGDTKVETTAEKKKIASNLFKFYYDIKFCPCVDDDKDIRYDALLDWVNSFRELLVIQNQSKLFAMSLGRLFAHSPKGKDGYFPHESVRRIIEKMRDENIGKEYTIETFNKRGVYSPNAGISETKIADTYKENANAIRTGYPITAAIYDKMSADYYLEAARERRAAEDEF